MKVLSETISEEGLETGVVVMTDRLQMMISSWVELKQRTERDILRFVISIFISRET